MNYEIKFLKDALKSLQKQDAVTRNRILDHLKILSEDPRHPELDIKRMQGIEKLISTSSWLLSCSLLHN